MNRVLAVRGQVVPVVADAAHAPRPARPTASIVDGQSLIMRTPGIERVWFDARRRPCRPRTPSPRSPRRSSSSSGPGSLFTSLLPSLLVPAIRDAVLAAPAPRIFVCNVATQDGRDGRLRPRRPRRGAHRATPAPGIVDIVLANNQIAGAGPTGRSRAQARPAALAAAVDAAAAARPRRRRRPGRTPTTTTRTASRTRSSARSSSEAGIRRRDSEPVGTTDRRPDVTRSERDLVAAPARRARGDRPVPAVRPGRRGGRPWRPRCRTGRESLRRAGSPIRLPAAAATARQSGAASTGGSAADHCRLAWLRGRFLARGSLSLAGGRTHLEFVVDPAEAPILAARLADDRPAGVVADPPRPRRRHLEERRGRRARSCGRIGAGGGAPRARGPAGVAGAARRAEPGPQRGVGEPPACGQRRRPPARRDRRARGRRPARRAAARRPARRRRRAARRPRRPWPSWPSGSTIHRSAVQRALERIERLAAPRRRGIGRARPRADATAARARRAAAGPPLWHDSGRCAT